MEFELAVTAEAAAELARLKPLQATREGRSRNVPVKVIWHDSPDHALLAQGLTLAQHRDAWRLERLAPGATTWLPAQPAPVVAQAADPGALPNLPAPIAPLAAFEGRRAVTVHKIGEAAPVTVTIDKGVLRAVTAERPAARILISGEESAVRQAAVMIATAVPAAVPLSSLAAEGIALATGAEPRPRHTGAPVLPEEAEAIPAALAHIIGHLTDVMLFQAARLDDGPEAVHQMRVAVRRARSALSMFRAALPAGALDAPRAAFKALGQSFGPTRDWDVFADETAPAIQQVLPGDERLERLAVAANRRRRDCQKALAAYLASVEFRLTGMELAWFAAATVWHPAAVQPAEAGADVQADAPDPPPVLATFAGQVLQHRWKRLVSAGKRMEDMDIPSLHGVRLRAKQARYAAEMFATLHQGKAAARFIRRLSELQQRLGVLNDGAVATQLLVELGGPGGRHAYATGVVTGFMAARAEKIRPRIIAAFDKFRRQPVYWA